MSGRREDGGRRLLPGPAERPAAPGGRPDERPGPRPDERPGSRADEGPGETRAPVRGPPAPPSLFPDLPAPPPARASRRRTPGPRRPARTVRLRAAPPPRFPPPPRPAEPSEPPRPPGLRLRILAGAVLLAVWGSLIVGRLVETQVFEHEVMVARARAQHQYELTIPPFRGTIQDRLGRPLALTIAVDSVYAVPPDYAELDVPAAAAQLARCLDVPKSLVVRRLRRDSRFSWLKRKARPAEVACAQETGLPVNTLEEYGRFYPGGSLAAQLVGYVGVDGDGLGGIEHALDPAIRGEPGRRTVWTDGRRTERGSRVVRTSLPGADVELTLDSRTQAIAEEELARGIEETGAAAGAVILIEPATGEVLAMASAPSFDPNLVRHLAASSLVNRNITDPYEPGSVFKIFTAAAALNEGVTRESEKFDTFGGRYRVGSRTIRDWKPLGPLDFAGIIRHSSNIGILQVARRLGSKTLGDYLRSFGFGDRTGLPLSGESRGIVPASDRWRPIRLATVSFGQGIAVTPVQMVQGVNVIANGGVHVPLRLIRRVGSEPAAFGQGRRVVTSRTAARVGALLAGVVEGGTGSAARVRGFRVAGKTGTAQKAVRGGYSPTDYIASFAGFAPAPAPLFTGVVILDTHKPNHSGANAARVFGRIAERVLRRYRQTGTEAERLVAAMRPPEGLPRPGAIPQPAEPTRSAAGSGSLLRVSQPVESPGSAAARLPARDAAALALRRAARPSGFGPSGDSDRAPEPGPPRFRTATASLPNGESNGESNGEADPPAPGGIGTEVVATPAAGLPADGRTAPDDESDGESDAESDDPPDGAPERGPGRTGAESRRPER